VSALLRALLRLVLRFGCVEALAMCRAYPGTGYGVMLAVLFVIKHQVLAYLPASQGSMEWHRGSAVMLGLNLFGRFVFKHAAWRCSLVPSDDPGRLLLWPAHWRKKFLLLSLEPALVLGFILVYEIAEPPYFLRFVPMFWWDGLPLPYGIVQPYPAWYLHYATTIARGLPFLTVAALWLNNRCEYAASEEGQRDAEARQGRRTTEPTPVFTPVTLAR